MTHHTEAERAKFEAAYLSEKKRLLPGSSDDHLRKWFLGFRDGEYVESEAKAAWWAWQAAPAISEEDRRELVAGAGLLAGHGHQGSAQALMRVLGIPVQQSEPVAVVDGGTPGPWSVRKRLGNDGEVLDCFVTAPDCQGLAYAAEILGDDEYRDGIKRRLADCELIVAAVNAYRAANAAPQAVQAAVPTIAELEASAELGALRDVYEMARGVLRFDGIDMERALKYKDGLIEAIETVKTIDGGTWEPAHPTEGVPAQAVHQIAEPAAPVGKPIEDAIDALVWAAFTEGGCSEHRMSEARIQTELRKKELCTLLSTPQACCRSHPHEEMTPMCELRTEIARLTNALARAEAQLAAAPQAVQAAVMQDVERWPSVEVLADAYEDAFGSKPAGNIYVNLSVLALALQERSNLAATAHPAEGVPAPVVDALQSLIEAIQFSPLGILQIKAMERARAALAATQPAAQGMEQSHVEAVILEHSGCGSNTQVDMLTVRLNPGDKVVMRKGRITQAFERAEALATQAKQGGAA